ncbi:MAG: radical SAM protein [Trueperaceae bacterium]|nr:radical SAM protein [Trueperaceae bacterium]
MVAPRRTGWLAAVHPAATTLSPTRDTVVAFDLEGRPSSWLTGGDTFKRSLASDVYGRRTVHGTRRRWRVAPDRAHALFERALEVATEARRALAGGERLTDPAHEAELTSRLERIAAWTPGVLQDERHRFARAYAPLSILPPDQYGAVVLQATFGCSWNRCTYCTFYQGRPFQVRPLDAFDAHVAEVRALLGRAAAGRAGVFLADGNALVLSNDRLRPLFEAATATFPDRPVAGFVDVFSGERKPREAWRELRELGLRRVAIGVETGHDPLLAYVNKPGSAADAADFVHLLKEAGLEVAVILMVGVGGRRYAEGHARDSARLLARLPLGTGDIVYLSPFVRHEDAPYAQRAEADGLEDLSDAERQAQEHTLRQAAREAVPAARVARYHIDEFVY